jgi:hypothetical protein
LKLVHLVLKVRSSYRSTIGKKVRNKILLHPYSHHSCQQSKEIDQQQLCLARKIKFWRSMWDCFMPIFWCGVTR